MGRPSGSKNKTKSKLAIDLNSKAQYFADVFISSEHINGAEKLALRILEKIRSSKLRLQDKYGGQ